MEQWVPLFDIFMNSPTPETETSLCLQQNFNAKQRHRQQQLQTRQALSSLCLPNPATHLSKTHLFLHHHTKKSRILPFLALENERFNAKELSKLSGSGEELVEEFESMPDWLEDMAAVDDPLLYWLPLSGADFCPSFYSSDNDDTLFCQFEKTKGSGSKEVEDKMEVVSAPNVPLQPEIETMAVSLRDRVINSESIFKAVALANEIRQLCLDKGVNPLQVLSLIEPLKAEDETESVLISRLLSDDKDELAWPSQVLSSIVLPKFLVLSEPASHLNDRMPTDVIRRLSVYLVTKVDQN
ncbi:uncharacterized protein LOC120148743 [Hibiscus syriacus]|uniref:uncharacterized protein LOC120148743 n=1 Tax=Hibiscus syriacus TaxID=106335 RepID=UPI0019221B42|nr:uncharacterized protein LOC120148743 [Hibiscus syriacus]